MCTLINDLGGLLAEEILLRCWALCNSISMDDGSTQQAEEYLYIGFWIHGSRVASGYAAGVGAFWVALVEGKIVSG